MRTFVIMEADSKGIREKPIAVVRGETANEAIKKYGPEIRAIYDLLTDTYILEGSCAVTDLRTIRLHAVRLIG